MSQIVDLTGITYGRLTVLEWAGKTNDGKSKWKCQCECGNIAFVRGYDMRKGKTKSCGCLRIESTRKLKNKNMIHNGTNTRLYRIWSSMKERCKTVKFKNYKNYGGRGITVCEDWMNNFKSFSDWAIYNGYSDSLTLDRIDNNGDYCPENCRWITMKEQQNNRRNNVRITHNGKTQTISQWADETGISSAVIGWRIKAGWPESDLFIPVNLNNKYIRKAMENKC